MSKHAIAHMPPLILKADTAELRESMRLAKEQLDKDVASGAITILDEFRGVEVFGGFRTDHRNVPIEEDQMSKPHTQCNRCHSDTTGMKVGAHKCADLQEQGIEQKHVRFTESKTTVCTMGGRVVGETDE